MLEPVPRPRPRALVPVLALLLLAAAVFLRSPDAAPPEAFVRRSLDAKVAAAPRGRGLAGDNACASNGDCDARWGCVAGKCQRKSGHCMQKTRNKGQWSCSATEMCVGEDGKTWGKCLPYVKVDGEQCARDRDMARASLEEATQVENHYECAKHCHGQDDCKAFEWHPETGECYAVAFPAAGAADGASGTVECWHYAGEE